MALGEGHWRFEAKGGTTVLDSGPLGLDGTLNPQPFRTTEVPVDPVPQDDAVNGAWGRCNGCAEDLDGSGVVNSSDLALILVAWGGC